VTAAWGRRMACRLGRDVGSLIPDSRRGTLRRDMPRRTRRNRWLHEDAPASVQKANVAPRLPCRDTDGIVKEFRDSPSRETPRPRGRIIIGAAFGTVVKSLVDDVIMPIVGLLLGASTLDPATSCSSTLRRPGRERYLAQARTSGADRDVWRIHQQLITFLIVAWASSSS